jgi:hypothetical protein
MAPQRRRTDRPLRLNQHHAKDLDPRFGDCFGKSGGWYTWNKIDTIIELLFIPDAFHPPKPLFGSGGHQACRVDVLVLDAPDDFRPV